MSLAEEMLRIADIIKVKFPGAVVHFYVEPVSGERKDGQFVLVLKQDIRRSESLTQTWTQRQYTVIHYGEGAQQAVSRMDELSRHIMNERGTTPDSKGSDKLLRAESFTFDGAEEMENGKIRCSAVLQIQYREPVTVETFTKMKHVEVRVQDNLKGGH